MTDRYKRLAPFAGVLMVGLVLVALFLPQEPDAKASGAKTIAFYTKHHTAVNAASICLVFAAVAAVLYFTSVAAYLRRCGSQLLSATATVGGALFASGLLLAGGLLWAANDAVKHQATATAQALNILQNDAWAPMMFAGLAIATLSIGVAMLRTNAVPTALGVVTTVVGVSLFTFVLSWFAFMASGLLTIVIAGYVYVRQGRPDAITLPEIPQARTTTESAPAKARAKA